MATCYENPIKHLKLATRQLEQLKRQEHCADEDELYDLLHSIQSLEREMKEMLYYHHPARV